MSNNISLFVENIINKAVTNVVIDLEETLHNYRRLTFIQDNYCYICNKNSIVTYGKYTDDSLGKQGLYGWIYCDKCTKYVDAANKYKEYLSDHLFKYTYTLPELENISFWRKSRSNNLLSPYLVKICAINSDIQNGLFIHNNRLCISVKWNTNKSNEIDSILMKSIPLSNVIYFNNQLDWKRIWKKILEKSVWYDNNKWRNKWNRLFKKEYDIVCNWYYLKKAIHGSVENFPTTLLLHILDYWRDIYA